MSEDELFWYVVIFGGIALFTAALTVLTVRTRRSQDAEAQALRAATVLGEVQDLLVAPDPLWASWVDTAGARSMTMQIRDAHDADVAQVTVPAMVPDLVVRRITFDGRRYEVRKPGVASNRTVLCEEGTQTALYSAEHTSFTIRFFRGDGEEERLQLHVASVLQRFRRVEADGEEIGKLIIGVRGHADVAILTLPPGRCAPLEQVFVLASA